MNEKRIQILTLAFCAVLLGLNFWQGRKIETLKQQIWSAQSSASGDIRSLQQQVHALTSQIEEGEKKVQDWELIPAGMDRASNSLLTEVSLTLKEWRADTEVHLTARQGSGTHIVALKSGGTGRFSGSLPVSLNGESLSLEVRITSAGTSRQEELGGWEDISMLLPVQLTGSGYGGPTYHGGVFSVDHYTVDLSDRNYGPAAVKEPAFFLQRNGETIWERAAVLPEDLWEASGLSEEEALEMGFADRNGTYSAGGTVEADCEKGDTLALFFSCRDEYGLKYTFPLHSWKIDPGRDGRLPAAGWGSTGGPVLSWE